MKIQSETKDLSRMCSHMKAKLTKEAAIAMERDVNLFNRYTILCKYYGSFCVPNRVIA